MPATVMLLSLVSGISVGAVTVISQTAETSPQVAVMVALPISFSSFCALKMIEPLPHSLTFLISLFLRVKFFAHNFDGFVLLLFGENVDVVDGDIVCPNGDEVLRSPSAVFAFHVTCYSNVALTDNGDSLFMDREVQLP